MRIIRDTSRAFGMDLKLLHNMLSKNNASDKPLLPESGPTEEVLDMPSDPHSDEKDLMGCQEEFPSKTSSEK